MNLYLGEKRQGTREDLSYTCVLATSINGCYADKKKVPGHGGGRITLVTSTLSWQIKGQVLIPYDSPDPATERRRTQEILPPRTIPNK